MPGWPAVVLKVCNKEWPPERSGFGGRVFHAGGTDVLEIIDSLRRFDVGTHSLEALQVF